MHSSDVLYLGEISSFKFAYMSVPLGGGAQLKGTGSFILPQSKLHLDGVEEYVASNLWHCGIIPVRLDCGHQRDNLLGRLSWWCSFFYKFQCSLGSVSGDWSGGQGCFWQVPQKYKYSKPSTIHWSSQTVILSLHSYIDIYIQYDTKVTLPFIKIITLPLTCLHRREFQKATLAFCMIQVHSSLTVPHL